MTVPLHYRWLATALLVAALVAVSVVPARSQPGDTVFEWLVWVAPMPLQKVMHVLLYGLLAFLLAWALENVESRWTRYALALALSVSLGAVLEGLQTRIPGRFGTLGDILLNGGGALLGLALALVLL